MDRSFQRMANVSSSFQHDPRQLTKKFYDSAKSWWGFSLSLKVGAAAFGIYSVLLGNGSSLVPWTIAGIAFLSELSQWRSDALKSRAEGLQRKIDFHNSLGWPISRSDMSDHLVKVSGKTREAITKAVEEKYFASEELPSPKRALENLLESSWYSKDLTGWMVTICCVLMGIFVISSFAALITSISTIRDYNALQSVSRTVAAALSLLVSLGLLRLTIGYSNFCKKSEQTEHKAGSQLKAGTLDQIEAVKLWHEYQLSRASAPLIPDWIWKKRSPILDPLWKEYRKGFPD